MPLRGKIKKVVNSKANKASKFMRNIGEDLLGAKKYTVKHPEIDLPIKVPDSFLQAAKKDARQKLLQNKISRNHYEAFKNKHFHLGGQRTIRIRTGRGEETSIREIIIPVVDPNLSRFGDSFTRGIGARVASANVLQAAKHELSWARSRTKLGKLRHATAHLGYSALAKLGHDFYIDPNLRFELPGKIGGTIEVSKGLLAAGTAVGAGGYIFNKVKNMRNRKSSAGKLKRRTVRDGQGLAIKR
ncbi:MAG: hypothetical protein AABY07_10885 [Nanoarchaeota archaeon]